MAVAAVAAAAVAAVAAVWVWGGVGGGELDMCPERAGKVCRE